MNCICNTSIGPKIASFLYGIVELSNALSQIQAKFDPDGVIENHF